MLLLSEVGTPWVDDGLRVLSGRRAEHTRILRKELEAAGRTYVELSGSFAEREKDAERLVALLAAQSVKRGDFVLSSGRRSDLYIDARMTTMDPRGLTLIGPLGLAAIADASWVPDSVGGLTLGADPIAYAIAYASALTGRPLRAFTVRKEAKAHGTGKRIEGRATKGLNVFVVEDVTTSGKSTLEAVEVLRAAGSKVEYACVVVDREAGAVKALADAKVHLDALANVSTLLDTPEARRMLKPAPKGA